MPKDFKCQEKPYNISKTRKFSENGLQILFAHPHLYFWGGGGALSPEPPSQLLFVC